MSSTERRRRAAVGRDGRGARRGVVSQRRPRRRPTRWCWTSTRRLHEIHSENKAGTAAHYKGGFGFHPMYCTADATGEALGVRLRPGNAGANDIADHVDVLDQAIAGLPDEVAAGHRPGDDPGLVGRRVRVRTDSAGLHPFRSALPRTQHRFQCRGPLAMPVCMRRSAESPVRRRRLATRPDPDGEEPPGAAVASSPSSSTCPAGLRDPVDRAPRTLTSRRPGFAVPVGHLPLLGPLHRLRTRPSRSRCRHARPRPSRGQHPPSQGLRRVPVPVQRSRRQPGLARHGLLR